MTIAILIAVYVLGVFAGGLVAAHMHNEGCSESDAQSVMLLSTLWPILLVGFAFIAPAWSGYWLFKRYAP